ncbi:hypothetical protein GCM10029978_045410 [Actinoallomurus acanthiterrae]
MSDSRQERDYPRLAFSTPTWFVGGHLDAHGRRVGTALTAWADNSGVIRPIGSRGSG